MSDKNVYKMAVEELNPSPELIAKIKEGPQHKVVRFRKRKMAVLAAVVCMMIGTTAFAAGHITCLVSWSNPYHESTDYNRVCEYLKEADIKADIPKELSNGYEFKSCNTGRTKGIDGDGHTVASGKFFEMTYEKAGHSDLYLNIDPVFEEEDHQDSTEIREINGVTVYYNEDVCKYVPADYELTKEDEKNLENPHYSISCGSEKIEIRDMTSIVFVIDGKNYCLLSWNNDLSAEEWFEMAIDFLNR